MKSLLSRLQPGLRKLTEKQLTRNKRLVEIGIALTTEKNLDRLFEKILEEARELTNADAGTLYLVSDEEPLLNFALIQNDTLGIYMGGTGAKISWPPVRLRNDDDTPNYANVSAYAALSGEVVNIPDVYNAEGFNFEGTRHYDIETGYRSKSMLVIPMRNHENDIIGVLQLLNAKDPLKGEVISFSEECVDLTKSLASQAAVALSNRRLVTGLENLLEAFTRTIATAIDEKSPFTGGHVRRVTELTMRIAHKINEQTEGPFAQLSFSEDDLNELRFAAWLHDLGKITTPEYIIDKSTKLQTIYDRIVALKTRFELAKRDSESNAPDWVSSEEITGYGASENCGLKMEVLDEDFQFIAEVNAGLEYLTDENLARLKNISRKKWKFDNEWRPLLDEEELAYLSVRRGNLTNEERQIMNNHAEVTYKLLSQLPFPKKMRNVAVHAAAHHEKLDGTGYPFGLRGSEISLQSRIIAIADIFEALTAKDRPYKKEKSISEAREIMEQMVRDSHIDGDIFNLFVKEKIDLEYAKKELCSRPDLIGLES
ncbi:GAF and HD-GYP domain-containing protein [Syntrophus aciditrophicus]|uniref:HD-GYP domain protein n=1 Tax=Syntrophus aciditrophicus (strain SB) TaxID=56780 RepID=Q2LSR2_SYNAS|nr:HD family phosphohydrolase [Syntrophus aciditrophicus]ABC77124.1 HD-GYP domain protein [Syntrophus aciditrophicus SB]OPY18210.1 MAG: Cyclic di-GMP phosphodiesterase response regulator RpfG [Syntrophus sp. PtaB.Bin075]